MGQKAGGGLRCRIATVFADPAPAADLLPWEGEAAAARALAAWLVLWFGF